MKNGKSLFFGQVENTITFKKFREINFLVTSIEKHSFDGKNVDFSAKIVVAFYTLWFYSNGMVDNPFDKNFVKSTISQ